MTILVEVVFVDRVMIYRLPYEVLFSYVTQWKEIFIILLSIYYFEIL